MKGRYRSSGTWNRGLSLLPVMFAELPSHGFPVFFSHQMLLARGNGTLFQVHYCLRLTGGPLTRVALRLTFTSTRLAILIKGMPLFIP
jgi:hypothetical protein